jgi:SH3-like domain-containing protein
MLNARIASAGLSAFCIAGIGALAPSALLQRAAAQSPDTGTAATAPAAEPYIAVVTADNVYVRSAPSVQSSYPFGKLKRGDLVRVGEESFGWARVQTEGPAFAQIYGVVPADSRVTVSADGTTLSVNAKSELRAPNISTPDASLAASWKQIARLEPGATLSVVDRVDSERDSVYRVRLPAVAEGWVNMNFLRKASQAEMAKFNAPTTDEAATIAAADVVTQQVQPAAAAPADGGTTASATDAVATDIAGGTDAPIDSTGTATGGTDVIVTGGAKASEPALPPAPAKTPEQIAFERRRATMADLEGLYTTIRGQTKAEAELHALRGRYIDLAIVAAGDPEIVSKANGRAEQLRLEIEVQSRIIELERMKARIEGERDSIASVARAIEARSEYTVVGILNASLVYDGQRLPLLYRIQDPATGQTVAYVAPGPGFQLSTMLGNLLGFRGEKSYDEALRVDVVTPRTVDILTPRKDG